MRQSGREPVQTHEALTFKPVSAATRGDFVAVFAGRGGPKYCWCMVWRATAEERRSSTPADKEHQMLSRLDAGLPLGLVGYAGGDPVAWVSIAPRATYHTRLGGLGDDGSVWSLACMYIRRRLRGRGHTRDMIAAAIDHAARNGAAILEAYPVDPDSPSYHFMGVVGAFEAAGFAKVGRAGTRRHVMRLTLPTTGMANP